MDERSLVSSSTNTAGAISISAESGNDCIDLTTTSIYITTTIDSSCTHLPLLANDDSHHPSMASRIPSINPSTRNGYHIEESDSCPRDQEYVLPALRGALRTAPFGLLMEGDATERTQEMDFLEFAISSQSLRFQENPASLSSRGVLSHSSGMADDGFCVSSNDSDSNSCFSDNDNESIDSLDITAKRFKKSKES
jgi:hypothetical protein